MRFLVSISYDGSQYYGFERQPGKKTIQGELENVLTKINKTKVIIKGAGRTDRGVHAYDQKAHFDLNVDISELGLKKAMNSLLDSSIHINYCKIVDKNFHARFDVKEKVYEYVINLGEYDAVHDKLIYNYNKKLNIRLMHKASRYLLGMHSYEAFVSGDRESFNSMIYKISFIKKNDTLTIRFMGKRFYRYMVRNMVGALIYVGQGKGNPNCIKEMLDERKKTVNYMTVPANGLYLMKVEY